MTVTGAFLVSQMVVCCKLVNSEVLFANKTKEYFAILPSKKRRKAFAFALPSSGKATYAMARQVRKRSVSASIVVSSVSYIAPAMASISHIAAHTIDEQS